MELLKKHKLVSDDRELWNCPKMLEASIVAQELERLDNLIILKEAEKMG